MLQANFSVAVALEGRAGYPPSSARLLPIVRGRRSRRFGASNRERGKPTGAFKAIATEADNPPSPSLLPTTYTLASLTIARPKRTLTATTARLEALHHRRAFYGSYLVQRTARKPRRKTSVHECYGPPSRPLSIAPLQQNKDHFLLAPVRDGATTAPFPQAPIFTQSNARRRSSTS